MTRTDRKVGYKPKSKYSQDSAGAEAAARDTESALRMIEGRWKLVILYHLFVRPVMRFSELEKSISGISQKMLIQQLRELEKDGLVQRTIYPQVPPKVEYSLTKLGRTLIEPLHALCRWSEKHLAELEANRARAKANVQN